MRSLARLFGSIFFPFFRVWGETEIRSDRGCVYIARDFGLLTWISALRTFRKPFRFVCSNTDNWFNLATTCGLEPVTIGDDPTGCFNELEQRLLAKETLLLLIPENPDHYHLELVRQLKNSRNFTCLFMALTGSHLALAPGQIIPKVCPISLFCGMPHFQTENSNNPLIELEFLEKAITDVPLNELPSIFFNHSRNG